MRKSIFLKIVLVLIVLANVFVAKAQNPTYELYVTNQQQIDSKTYQFDVYLLNNSAVTFELATMQFGLGIDTSIVNGGTLTFSQVASSSQLVAAQVPTAFNVGTSAQVYTVGGKVYRYLNQAARTGPGTGNGTVISSTKTSCSTPGTRIGTYRLVNTVNFKSNSNPNHVFSTGVAAGRTNTVVNAYVGGSNVPITGTAMGYQTNGTCDQNITLNSCNVTASLSTTNAVCNGSNNGSATVTLSGAGTSSTGTYSLDGGTAVAYSSNPFTVSNLSAGSHTINVTSGSCTASTGSFTINQPAAIATSFSASGCNSYSLPWSQTVTASGSYPFVYTSVSGCDSTVTANITIKNSTTSTTSQSVCTAQLPYSWNNNNYNASGTYSVTLTNAAGCDSVATLVLTVNAASSSSTPVTKCSNQLPYSWNNNNYNASGTYSVTLTNAAGCDSVATLVLTVKATSSSSTPVTICSSQLPYSWNSNTYNTSGTYTATLTNAAGCDSIATLVLTVKSSSSSSTPVSVCSTQLPYSWNSNTYNTSGTYTATLTNAVGCDSVATLVLTVKSTTSSSTPVTTCTSQLPYSWNNDTYSASGTYSVALTNAAGCDSVATLVLTVKSSSTSSTPASVCSNQLPYSWNGNNYNTSGTYTATLTNAVGCDSVATLVLTVKSTSSSSTPVSVCSTQLPYSWNNNNYNASGTYSVTLTNAVGCDSVATLVLSVNSAASSSSTPVSLCSSQLPYSWNNNSYSAAGTYSVTLTNAAGCDSIATLVLQVDATIPVPTVNVSQTTCSSSTGTITVTSPTGAGYTYSIGSSYQSGTVFSSVQPGTYTLVANKSGGCFSTTTVTINTPPSLPGATTVTGQSNVCDVIGTTDELTYTASSAGAISYTWTMPPNTVLLSGQGTSTITVKFLTGFATQFNKQIKVVPTSTCGNGAQKIFYLTAQIPTTPAPITASATNICPNIGTGVSITYRIPKVIAAASYNWNFQALTTSISHPNGLGENDTVVTVTFTNGFTNSNITVQAVNQCGISNVRSLSVTRSNPSTPGLISGPTNACANVGSAGSLATYSVSPVIGITTYTWTIPAGATDISGQGTNSISFKFPTGYTTGSISVTASNGCGTSSARSLSVAALLPQNPGFIDVIPTAACPNRQFSYAIVPLANVTFDWTVPAGATIVSGQGTNNIIVAYPNTPTSGTLSVRSISTCGVSTSRNLTIRLQGCTNPFAPNSSNKGVLTQSSLDVNVYPNPSNSSFRLQVTTPSDNLPVQVVVMDLQGRVLGQIKSNPSQPIQLGAEWRPGIYMLQVRQGNQVKTMKLEKL